LKALWLEDGTVTVREVEPETRENEALIQVTLSGICGTDLEIVRGYYPYTGVLGHEFVGEVVAAPQASLVGKRIVGEINAACGACAACDRGQPTHCEDRTVLGIVERDGAHAEYLSLPVENLHIVPDNVTDEAAVFTEPLAAALEILEQVDIGPDDRVLIVGAGRLGQLVAQVLSLTGAHLRVVAKHPRQQELLGARVIETVAAVDVEPRTWDIVVEATGSPSGLDLARTALRPRGTLVLKSTYAGEVTLDLSPFVVDEITIVGSRCGPFDRALGLLERADVDPTILIDERFPLDEGVDALEAATRPGTLKVLLDR
jgi:threonine dehydrogenase-like Zn-dependent dehydrogenase